MCLQQWAEATPGATVVAAPGREPLTFADLWAHIGRVGAFLAGEGISCNDRVVLFLPPGAEAAVATIAVSLWTGAVPLDPQAKEAEIEAYLEIIEPRLVICAVAGLCDLLKSLCGRRGWSLREVGIRPDEPAGLLDWTSAPQGRGFEESAPASAPPDTLSLFLATSGSSGRPKFVPLTHRNLAAAAANTCAFLALTPGDRSVHALPLFHGHGLVGGAMGPLSAGSAVMFLGAFAAGSFLRALIDFRATWFTAVPAMHQALLAEVPAFRKELAECPLRFLRSGSAPLPTQVKAGLERALGAPLLNRYGLTEALQLVSEPLDPALRRPGSLGTAALGEVRAMGEDGRLLPPGESGEIVCRGPNVFGGYWRLPEATAAVFRDGWFRTGDTGYVDEAGFLFLQGRLKDHINTGGEKVSPVEVESVLVQHPGVSEAVVLGVPDDLLGQAVAAVIVPSPRMTPTAAGVRAFAATRLAPSKVPRRMLLVADIPRSPLGKPLRAEIAERYLPEFERLASRPPERPHDPTEFRILEIWEKLLSHRPMGVEHDFFDCGGNSLTAARMVEEVNAAFGSDLHPVDLFEATTVRAISRLLKRTARGSRNERPLVTLRKGGLERPQFVFVSGDYLGGGLYCHGLAKRFPPGQSFHFFAPYDLREAGAPPTIEAQAAAFFRTLRNALPRGPYVFGGFSHGAYIALEMARLARAAGDAVPDVIVLDMLAPHPRLIWLRRFTDLLGFWRGRDLEARMWRFRRARLEIAYRRARLRGQPGPVRDADDLRAEDSPHAGALAVDAEERRAYDRLAKAYEKVLRHYVPKRYPGRISVIAAERGAAGFTQNPALGWKRVSPHVRTFSVPGSHFELVTRNIGELGDALARCLEPLP